MPDIVTRVPPGVGYRHVGSHLFFDSEGRLFQGPDEIEVHDARFRARTDYFGLTLLLPGRVKIRDLADHAIVNYVESLRRAIEASRQR